jgi:hypothetical protein
VFAGVYTARMNDPIGSLSERERERATESIEEASDVATGLARPARELLLARADDAFDVAARAGFGVCAGILLLAAATAAVALRPSRAG